MVVQKPSLPSLHLARSSSVVPVAVTNKFLYRSCTHLCSISKDVAQDPSLDHFINSTKWSVYNLLMVTRRFLFLERFAYHPVIQKNRFRNHLKDIVRFFKFPNSTWKYIPSRLPSFNTVTTIRNHPDFWHQRCVCVYKKKTSPPPLKPKPSAVVFWSTPSPGPTTIPPPLRGHQRLRSLLYSCEVDQLVHATETCLLVVAWLPGFGTGHLGEPGPGPKCWG